MKILSAIVLAIFGWLCLLFYSSTAANAGAISFLQGQFMEEIQPDASYTVDTAGFNIRVYEWTPQTTPGTVCIASFSNKAVVGFHCEKREAAPSE